MAFALSLGAPFLHFCLLMVVSFQAAAKKRSRRHLAETDEFVSSNNEMNFTDTVAMATAYQKMTSVCVNIKNEIFTDIEIHDKHILPRYNFSLECYLNFKVERVHISELVNKSYHLVKAHLNSVAFC